MIKQETKTDDTELANAADSPWQRPELLWPSMIIGLLVVQMLLLLVMAYVATSDRSFAVEPDYYHKAMHWNQLAAQDQNNERLGWSARINVGDAADVLRRRAVVCTLSDGSGQPLPGVHVDMVAFPHARGNERTQVPLAELDAGRYQADMTMTRSGLWEFRITANRGSDRFTQVIRQQVEPAGATMPWRR